MKLKPKTLKGQATYERIIGAAAACFAEIGIDKTTVSEIAELAQVPRSLVARYIPKKADLVMQVIEFWDSKRVDTFNELEHLDPFDRLITDHQDVTHYLEKNSNFSAAVLLIYYYSQIDPRIAKYCGEFSKSAERKAIECLVDENVRRKTKVSREDLRRFGVQIANMQSMHLIKRFSTPILDKKIYDQEFHQILRKLWNSFFELS